MSDREAKAGPYILRFHDGDMARLFHVGESGTPEAVGWGDYFPVVVQFAGEVLKLEAQVAAMREDRDVIRLTKAEVQSNMTRVKWAENLILQLPDTHDGRNSWLLNYGVGPESDAIRKRNAERRSRQ